MPQVRSIVVFTLAVVTLIFQSACGPASSPEQNEPTATQTDEQAPTPQVQAIVDTNALQALNNEQIRYDKTVFAHEVDAQAYESAFVALWDRLRSMEPYKVFRQFPFVSLELTAASSWEAQPLGPDGIRKTKLNGEKILIDHPRYISMIDQFEKDGWRVAQTEWHHSHFYPGTENKAPQSIVSFEVHATNESQNRRAAIKGKLDVTRNCLLYTSSEPTRPLYNS